jgi:hypothetical protein
MMHGWKCVEAVLATYRWRLALLTSIVVLAACSMPEEGSQAANERPRDLTNNEQALDDAREDESEQMWNGDASATFTVERSDGWPFEVTLSKLEPRFEFGTDVSQSPPGRARVVARSLETVRSTVTPAATDRETPNPEGWVTIEYTWAGKEFDADIMRQATHVPRSRCSKAQLDLYCRYSTSPLPVNQGSAPDEPSAFAEWPEDAADAIVEWLASTEPNVTLKVIWRPETGPTVDVHGCYFEQGRDGALDFSRALGSCRILR